MYFDIQKTALLMLVTTLCQWLYDKDVGDRFNMLATIFVMWVIFNVSNWSPNLKSVAKILQFSPTHFVSNIHNQHRWSPKNENSKISLFQSPSDHLFTCEYFSNFDWKCRIHSSRRIYQAASIVHCGVHIPGIDFKLLK